MTVMLSLKSQNMTFMTKLGPQLQQIYRALAAGGRLVLSYSEHSPDNKTRFPKEQVEAKYQQMKADNPSNATKAK